MWSPTKTAPRREGLLAQFGGVRGLAGVEIVTSDAHRVLNLSLASELLEVAWQRCRTHFMRNLLTKVAKSAQNLEPQWCAQSSISQMPMRSELRLDESWSSWRIASQ
jgi:transposase-like protein